MCDLLTLQICTSLSTSAVFHSLERNRATFALQAMKIQQTCSARSRRPALSLVQVNLGGHGCCKDSKFTAVTTITTESLWCHDLKTMSKGLKFGWR